MAVLRLLTCLAVLSLSPLSASETEDVATPMDAARRIDTILNEAAGEAGIKPAPLVNDADYLRRVMLDLSGTIPSLADIRFFELNADTDKRQALIERQLEDESYARNWSFYWRDVIYRRATNMRAPLSRGAFEAWMFEQFKENRPWDEVATEIITATGDVSKNGAAGLIFAQEGQPEEIAAEVSRIFLGIQIQCANCHDHPFDDWKREQFHELAAYFPRVSLRRERVDGKKAANWYVESRNRDTSQRRRINAFTLRRMDRNRDGVLSKQEMSRLPRLARNFDRLKGYADKNKDGKLTIQEIMTAERPTNDRPGRGSMEHYMPNLEDPGSKGEQVNPKFFAFTSHTDTGLTDADRRTELSKLLTAKENPWFAKAYVNRIWSELMGAGFYQPIDDMGPQREAAFESILSILSEGFARNNYDVKWLFRAIMSSDAYQRQLAADATPETITPSQEIYAAARTTRLRGDQVYNAIQRVFGTTNRRRGNNGRGMMMGGGYGRRSPRVLTNALFGYDPSTAEEDLTGSIPQALFMMNSPQLSRASSAEGFTRLAGILRDSGNDQDAIAEVYLLALGRRPTKKESSICRSHVRRSRDRGAAFEDILWSLVNSAEFLTRR